MGVSVLLLTVAVLSLLVSAGASAGAEDLEPWAGNTHPTDVRRQHVEDVSAGRHEYVVTQGGTMDGRSCRSPFGVFDGWTQAWESNRLVRIENVGRTDVVNPWLSNGRNDFRTIVEIAQQAVEPGMTDREKALALWFQELTHRHHAGGDNKELGDPVKVYNVYGHNTCGNDSICMAGLWTRAGMKATPTHPQGHCISQVFYDGRWNLMDADLQGIYLLRDNRTVADEQDLVRDHDLVKRTHAHGILRGQSRSAAEGVAAAYTYEGGPVDGRDANGLYTMAARLRPGEALLYRWGHLDPVKCSGTRIPKLPDTVCNGLWEYRPDLAGDLWRRGAESVEGVQATPDGLAAEASQVGTVVWKMGSPYVFIGGRLNVEGEGAQFAVSWDGQEWLQTGTDLDGHFPLGERARYHYYLKCTLEGDARLTGLSIVNDIQTAPLGMPEMVVGENRFAYTDKSGGERRVRVTHEWVERSATQPPTAPAAPVFPPDGGEAEGTEFAFQWQPADDPDGDAIADYHFMLADRPDMKYPLSMDFWKLISLTADKGTAQYTLPLPGMLTPGTAYYWRVRAQDEHGVWGPWSQVWSFTPKAPAHPLEVALDYDPASGAGTLRWQANPVGRAPAKYRVYGSDEKGFSVSDEPYEVHVGEETGGLARTFPANFVAETSDTQLTVLGVGLDLPNANKAHYRVVAVDENGNRSWSSDYATALRPFIYTEPVTEARGGDEYACRVAAIRSLGDVRHRRGAKLGLWDIEHPEYSLERGPDWLRIDKATGVLSGTPPAAGQAEVVVTAVIDREVREVDETLMKWGRERVVSTRTERVGTATQRFVIKIAE